MNHSGKPFLDDLFALQQVHCVLWLPRLSQFLSQPGRVVFDSFSFFLAHDIPNYLSQGGYYLSIQIFEFNSLGCDLWRFEARKPFEEQGKGVPVERGIVRFF